MFHGRKEPILNKDKLYTIKLVLRLFFSQITWVIFILPHSHLLNPVNKNDSETPQKISAHGKQAGCLLLRYFTVRASEGNH